METPGKNAPGSLCPAMASADLIGDKWTLLILRELFLGTTRFSEFQRALPRISPSILSKRLKTLETGEIIIRKTGPSGRTTQYRLTRSGRELGPVIDGMAIWGLRWRSRRIAARDCDVGAFMWDFHRTLKADALPDGETIIRVRIADRSDLDTWWILANGDVVDLCTDDPGHEVDVYITAPLECLVSLWMGDITIRDAVEENTLLLDGPRLLVQSAPDWFAQSPYADIRPADQPGVPLR